MEFLIYSIHVLTSLFLILVVLLQQGKGADLSVFGGGTTMAAFGARGAASLLHKLTVTGFVLFIVTTLSIGIYQKRNSSVVAGLEGEEVATEAPAAGEEGAEAATEVTPALPEAQEFSISSPPEEEAAGEEGEAEPDAADDTGESTGESGG